MISFLCLIKTEGPLDPNNANRKAKLAQKKEQVLTDIDSVLSNLDRLSGSDDGKTVPLARTSQTTDDISMAPQATSPRQLKNKQVSTSQISRLGQSMRASGERGNVRQLSASTAQMGVRRGSGSSSPSSPMSSSGAVKVAQLKSRASADAGNVVDKTDELGRTALMHAALKGEAEKVKSLLKAGAQVTEKCEREYSIRSYCFFAGQSSR